MSKLIIPIHSLSKQRSIDVEIHCDENDLHIKTPAFGIALALNRDDLLRVEVYDSITYKTLFQALDRRSDDE